MENWSQRGKKVVCACRLPSARYTYPYLRHNDLYPNSLSHFGTVCVPLIESQNDCCRWTYARSIQQVACKSFWSGPQVICKNMSNPRQFSPKKRRFLCKIERQFNYLNRKLTCFDLRWWPAHYPAGFLCECRNLSLLWQRTLISKISFGTLKRKKVDTNEVFGLWNGYLVMWDQSLCLWSATRRLPQ